MITVQVPLAERAYSIHIGQQLLGSLAQWLPEVLGACRHTVIVADQHVIASHGRGVTESLQAAGYRVSVLEVPSGESSKSLAQADQLWQQLLQQRADRGSAILALGGGVVGDLAGFVAATFARGLPLIQLPTTLLSQVDSSVGGKTGINLPQAKNMVGVFWQPALVIIDTDTLSTLPRREFISGLAEIVKYGVILRPELFDYLENHVQPILNMDPTAITHIIAESCRAKAEVVVADEREITGLRAILNYGHTFAHALEAAGGYGNYSHGEAVAVGMHLAARCALRLGRVDADFVQRQENLLNAFGLPVRPRRHDPQHLWQLMQHDKKVQHGSLRFILPDRLGHVELVAGVPQALVIEELVAAMPT